MGDELGNATYIVRLLASSALSTPIFTLIGNDYFGSCHTNLLASKSRGKKNLKYVHFEFSWISRRDRVRFSNCLDLHRH